MATLRLQLDTTQLVRGANVAEDALEDVAAKARMTAEATDNIGTSMPMASRGMGGMTHNARGLAMQLSQVTDMGLATGQWGKAFFMQASDIAMLLGGPWAIGIGMAVGVLGTLGLSFLNVGEDAKTLEERIEELAEVIDEYDDLVKSATMSNEALTAEFGKQAEAAREAYLIMAENRRLELAEDAAAMGGALVDPFGVSGRMGGLQAAGVAEFFNVDRSMLVFTDAAREARDEFDQLANRALEASEQLSRADGIDAQIDAARNMLTVYRELADMDGERTEAEREYISAVGETIVELGKLQQIDQDLAQSLMESGMNIGSDIVAGMIGGIEGATPDLIQATEDMAGQVEEVTRDILDIRSPSRVMRQLGKWVVEGFVGGINEGAEDVEPAARSAFGGVERGASNVLMALVDNSKDAKTAWRDMVTDMVRQAYQLQVVQPIVSGLFGGGGGQGGGFLGNVLGGLFGGFRAEGGPVDSGTPYIVGERGPELFVPSSSGNITSNKQMGGGVVNHFNYTFTGGVTEGDLRNAIPSIVEASTAAVLNKQQRGGTYARAF